MKRRTFPNPSHCYSIIHNGGNFIRSNILETKHEEENQRSYIFKKYDRQNKEYDEYVVAFFCHMLRSQMVCKKLSFDIFGN
jgi:hypothetical protein